MKAYDLIRGNWFVFALIALIWCAIAGMRTPRVAPATGAERAKNPPRAGEAAYRQVFFHGFARKAEAPPPSILAGPTPDKRR